MLIFFFGFCLFSRWRMAPCLNFNYLPVISNIFAHLLTICSSPLWTEFGLLLESADFSSWSWDCNRDTFLKCLGAEMVLLLIIISLQGENVSTFMEPMFLVQMSTEWLVSPFPKSLSECYFGLESKSKTEGETAVTSSPESGIIYHNFMVTALRKHDTLLGEN